MDLSIVIPVFNEEKNIIPLLADIRKTMEGVKLSYEIIAIDDGSTDKTFYNLISMKRKCRNLKVIGFIRNFGKSAALNEGLAKAKGRLIITMDGDLEDDPREIPRFIAAIENGSDMVVGWRYRRKHSLSKRFFSKIYNWMIKISTGVSIHDSNCGFKIMRREVVKSLYLYGELHRYIPSMAGSAGFKVNELKIKHRIRGHGKSKYTNVRILKGFFDLLTVNFLIKYSARPLHFFGVIGMFLFLTGSATVIALYARKFFWGVLISSNPFLFILGILCIILSVQFISLGLLGEMINRNSDKGRYIFKRDDP